MPPLTVAVAAAWTPTVPVPEATPLTRMVIVAPGSAVPVKSGVGLFVMLSESRGGRGKPVSVAVDRMGVGAVGTVVSIVTGRPGLLELGLPARSLTTAVYRYIPSGIAGPGVLFVGSLWLRSAIATTPPRVFVRVLTSTGCPGWPVLGSISARNSCTVTPGSSGLARVPTSKTGAFDGPVFELFAWVIPSLLEAPVSLAASSTRDVDAGGVRSTVMASGVSTTLFEVKTRFRAVPAGESSVTAAG